MITFVRTATMTAAIALLGVAPSAVAQENHFKITCQGIGPQGAPEPVGDRAGHAISVSQESCRIESGSWSGAVLTGGTTWEWDGPSGAVLVAGGDVARKPGAITVSVLTEGKLALTMADGKVTGWTATGKGHWPVGELAGKSFTYTAKSTAAGQWEVDGTVE